MSRLQVVVGGQYGSEAKGAIAGYLGADLSETDLAVRVGGPNAGHSVADDIGRIWPFRQVPAPAVTGQASLWIAPGSEIDLPVLRSELDALDEAGFTDVRARLTVDKSATIITNRHKETEADARLTDRIGSTGKGIGAARADRLMRNASTAGDYPELETSSLNLARVVLDGSGTVLIEGTQGWGLGLHTRHYPQTTSGDCTAVDFCAQAGVSPWMADEVEIWVVVRPNPIRVAGNSGYLKDETTWEALDLPPELTTVTRKVRRVGGWDTTLVRHAIMANGGATGFGGMEHGPVRLALSMADHLDPDVTGSTAYGDLSVKVRRFIDAIEKTLGTPVLLVGTSPSTVVDLR